MLDDAVPEPQPVEEDTWGNFVRREMERTRAIEAIQAAREAGERDREMLRGNQRPDRPDRVERIHLGVGRNGLQQVGIWDPVMRRYNIRDEE